MQTETNTNIFKKIGWLPILIAAAVILAVILLLTLRRGGDQPEAEAAGSSELIEASATPEPTDVVYTLESYAASHGYTRADYPEALLELYDMNPDARQVVMEYPARKDDNPSMDLTADDYTPGEIPLLMQWDVRWGYRQYNESFFARTGCCPTAMSMAVIGLTGDTSVTPWVCAEFSTENGYCIPGSGTIWDFVPAAAEHFGLHCQELGLDEGLITSELEAGNVVMIEVGPGDFTEHGHYLLITGRENGMFRVNDPFSRRNSEQLWTYERIAPQIEGMWTLSA